MICVTLHKMEDEREDEREVIFKFIEEVHNCPAVWDILSAAYKDTKSKQIEVCFVRSSRTSVLYLLIYGFVQTFLFLTAFCFFSGD